MKKLFLLSVCFYAHTILPAGFVAGTLINTPAGLIPIEQVKEGDDVFALGVDGCCYAKYVAFVSKKEESQLIKLIINGEVILTTPEQCFFKDSKMWASASALHVGDKLMSAHGPLMLEAIEPFRDPVNVYRLSIVDLGNFCVGKHSIWVYDFNPWRNSNLRVPKKPLRYVLLEKMGEFAVYGGVIVVGGYLVTSTF